MTALDTLKVAPLAPGAGAVTDTPEALEYQAALNQSMKALEQRMQPPNNLNRIAAGFLKPTRSGSFGESLGNVNEEMAKEQERQQQEALPIAQMRAQLAGQKYQVAQETKDREIFGNIFNGKGSDAISDAYQTLSNPMGVLGNPAMFANLQRALGGMTPGTKSYQQVKDLLGVAEKAIDLGLKQQQFTNDQLKTWFEEVKLGDTVPGFKVSPRPGSVPQVVSSNTSQSTTPQTSANQSGKTEQVQFDPTKSYGTPPQILDNVNQIESSGGKNLLNPTSKALGPYQFTPETLVDLHKRGVQFNPLDDKQSRSAADWYLSELYKKTGSWEKALAAYGGFQTKDPTNYVSQAMRGVTTNNTPTNIPSAESTVSNAKTTAPVPDELYKAELQRIADNNSLTPAESRKAQVEAQNRLAARQGKEAETRTEINTAEERSFQQGLGTENVKSVIKIRNDAETSQDLVRLADNQISLVASRPTAFGWLSDPSLASSLIADANAAHAKGVEFSPQRISQYLGGVTDKDDLKAINLYLNNAGQINLAFAKIDLKGQGATSDSERKLVSIMGGLPSDSPDVIRIKADALKQRSQRDIDLHKAWSDFHESNPSASYDKFLRSDNYIEVKNKYTSIFDNMRDATSKLLQANPIQSSQKTQPKKGSLEERINQLGGQ